MEPGELVSLLGPSGCGKTTALRIAAGFERPDSGAMLVDDRDVLGVPPHRRNMGMVFQSYSLFPNLDVTGNVAFGFRQRLAVEHPGERIDHGLAAVVDVRAHQRGGQDRRADDQRQRRDEQHRVGDDGVGVGAERDGEHEHQGHAHAERHAARREAGAEGDHRDREPGQRRRLDVAGDRHRAGDRHLAERPGAEEEVLGPRRARRAPLCELEEPRPRPRAGSGSTSRATARTRAGQGRSRRSTLGAPGPDVLPCPAAARGPCRRGRATT